jgi:hypothetical protein
VLGALLAAFALGSASCGLFSSNAQVGGSVRTAPFVDNCKGVVAPRGIYFGGLPVPPLDRGARLLARTRDGRLVIHETCTAPHITYGLFPGGASCSINLNGNSGFDARFGADVRLPNALGGFGAGATGAFELSMRTSGYRMASHTFVTRDTLAGTQCEAALFLVTSITLGSYRIGGQSTAGTDIAASGLTAQHNAGAANQSSREGILALSFVPIQERWQVQCPPGQVYGPPSWQCTPKQP